MGDAAVAILGTLRKLALLYPIALPSSSPQYGMSDYIYHPPAVQLFSYSLRRGRHLLMVGTGLVWVLHVPLGHPVAVSLFSAAPCVVLTAAASETVGTTVPLAGFLAA